MLIDALARFSDSQALTATAASTDYMNLGPTQGDQNRNLGDGEPLALVISVEVAADTADADETYQFDLETDDNTGFASATVIATRTIAGADLTAGSIHVIVLPPLVDVEQYLRVNYTLGGTTPSVTVSAYLLPMSFIQKWKSYNDNITIS